tara:strand:- start:459 stop:731 length:273 start_codon:yes stop_codon:yes gene_type:complete
MPVLSFFEWALLGFCGAVFIELAILIICLVKLCHSIHKSKDELAKLVDKLPVTFDKSEWPKRFWDWLHHLESKHLDLDKPCEEGPKKPES